MYKWMYDRMKADYKNRAKEDLMQEIMSLENIECSDRSFANQCESGTSVYSINELFEKLTSLLDKDIITDKDKAELLKTIDSANSSWKYIKRGLREMNNDSRIPQCLNEFRAKVNKAKDDMDTI